MNKRNTILVTSIGKRVQLIKHLSKSFNIVGVDAGDLNPCRYFVDKFYKIHKASDINYISNLLKICEDENVRIIIPLYEGEFSKLNDNKSLFEKINTKIMLSSEKIIEICKDKYKTFEYFTSEGIKTPKVYSKVEIENIIETMDTDKLPLFIKPRDGMGSSNTFRINSIKELEFFKDYVKDGIIQECIEGTEYTVDVLIDFNGKPVYIIPRERIEVRCGEVVKSRTVRDDVLINETIKVIYSLNKLQDEKNNAAVGPLTIQFFKTDKHIYLLEINPRFGGGVPLSFACGADYGSAIAHMINNEKISFANNYSCKVMLRFDDAIYIE